MGHTWYRSSPCVGAIFVRCRHEIGYRFTKFRAVQLAIDEQQRRSSELVDPGNKVEPFRDFPRLWRPWIFRCKHSLISRNKISQPDNWVNENSGRNINS